MMQSVNAGRLMKEGRAQAVKLEGGKEVLSTDRSNHQGIHPGCGSFGTDPAVGQCVRRIQGAGKIRRGS